jgi:hypothetical protein
MSIWPRIAERVRDQRLFELRPPPVSAPRFRRVLVTDGLHKALLEPPETDVERMAELEADLAVFIHSPTIDPGYLYKLSPTHYGVWEIRSATCS